MREADSLLRELKSLLREFFLYYNFSVKGCQVVKTPVHKGGCNLFEVVRGCQKVDRTFLDEPSVPRAERSERSMPLSVPKAHVFMLKLWHFVVVNILFTAEFSREFEPI